MKVYLLKDVEKIGMAGAIIKVSDGYALNFLIPRKLAIKVNDKNAEFLKGKILKAEVDKKILNSKVTMLAERIKNMHLVIKKRTHDNGKLYGAINADDIVELLKKNEININKKQVEFTKSIKTSGEHKVIIKLSSKLKPTITLKVIESE